MSPGDRIADAARRNLVDDLAPAALRPYLRLARIDRPIGWWLLLLPCWWSAALAAIAVRASWPSLWHLSLFLIGAIVMRGAGSTYNDLVDRKLDARVERTRGRPLASGAATPFGALALIGLLCLIGLGILLQFNGFTIVLGVLALVPVAIYPAMKRITNFPQVMLGLAFAWGGLMGWAAAFGRLDGAAWLIYACAVAWTFGYDTIYALQDIEDDEIVGIGSTARFFAENVAYAIGIAYVLAVVLAGGAIWAAAGGALAWLGLALFAGHLGWQVRSVRIGDSPLALRLFRSNRDAGLILFASLCGDAFLSATR